jgi:hypothetical protein
MTAVVDAPPGPSDVLALAAAVLLLACFALGIAIGAAGSAAPPADAGIG